MLNDKGYQEVITYSFVDPKVQQLLHPGEEALLLPSPISIEMSAMRLSLWTGLLSTVVYNQNRQQNACVSLKPVCVSCRIPRQIWAFVRI
ncbi:phenylalanyl-tRNA synthetase subunit beta [Citrobacter koseri]|uniref:Phenylalanyl-tRNA synthetase subunit beta n=1 Tax=Citrobacter koseri TaxID=545 RepID=A0A2X2WGI3_CITKO|nr:phenylalanyl-tRNA synthetase subunit beta [Citrobacter koseri]